MRKDFAERHSNNFYHEITALGGYVFCILVLLFFAVTKKFEMLWKLLLGFALIYLITIITRIFYFKERPDKYKYDSLLERIDASSFPSLHAARSAFVFCTLSKLIGGLAPMILSALIIVAIAYSRIRLKRHDAKDVAFGIILGLAASAAADFL